MTNMVVNRFKAEKQMKLMKDFKPFFERINGTFNNKLEFIVEYDTISIYTSDKNIETSISIIAGHIIDFAKEVLNENYNLPITSPGIIADYPTGNNKQYHWLLERKLKEGEPV